MLLADRGGKQLREWRASRSVPASDVAAQLGCSAREIYRWYTPLLQLDTKVKLVQYIKLATAEIGLGSEMVRPPRLPIAGAERDEILKIVRHAIATRPAPPLAAAR